MQVNCYAYLYRFNNSTNNVYPFQITINTYAEDLVICSLNVRGLSNNIKRRETFRWLKLKKYAIYFLQEVHCTKEKEILWTSEWGFSAIFSSFSSASVGTCILFNNNFEHKILKQFSDPEGRFVIVDIKMEEKILTLVNLYAPNDDNPTFFKNVLNQLLSFDCGEIILGSDYNLVMEVEKDKSGGNPTTHKNSLKEVRYIADSLDLVDIWRVLNPDAKRFTWRRRKPDIHCRLDFFLTSSSLSTTITKADILPGYKTDHSLITLHLANNTNPKGPGFWKLNTSILLDGEYVDLIKETINGVANDYKNDTEVDAILLWDTIKMQIRSSSLYYAKIKKAKMKSQETSLEADILFLQKRLEENNSFETDKTDFLNELDVKTLQKEEISKHKTRGTIIRSKSRWYNEGEKTQNIF